MDATININELLENEKIQNRSENWNKLNKTLKIQKLHAYSEKYGKEHALSVKDIKALKMYFTSCLDDNKLQRAKDVTYDKEKGVILNIPLLFYNKATKNFTIKSCEKHKSTIKSLTPKITNGEKN